MKEIDHEGKIESDFGKTDQIMGKVPAVPVFNSDTETYWGYTIVPEEGVKWWKSLASK